MSNLTSLLSKKIKTYFEHHLAAVEPSVASGNRHVFQVCLEHLSDRMSFEEKMQLIDGVVCYNKSLDHARENNLAASEHWLNKAATLPDFENKLLQKVLDINKIPATAYFHYANKDYDKAVSMLKTTIELCRELAEEAQIEYLIWGQMEEYINLFRTYCSIPNQAVAIQHAQAILNFLIAGKTTKGTLEHVRLDIIKKAEIDFLGYATGDVLYRLMRFESYDKSKIVKTIFEPIWQQDNWSLVSLEGYQASILLLKAWVEKDYEKMIAAFDEVAPTLYKQSALLQFYIFEALISLIKMEGSSEEKGIIANYVSQYYRQFLEFEIEFLNRYSLLIFEGVHSS